MKKNQEPPYVQDPTETNELERLRVRDEVERRVKDDPDVPQWEERRNQPEFVKGAIEPTTKK